MMGSQIDTFFWWLGAVTATCIAAALAAFMILLARQIFFTGLFVKRFIAAAGWRDDVQSWRKPIGFVAITWQWLSDPPTAVTAKNGRRVRHPLSKSDDTV